MEMILSGNCDKKSKALTFSTYPSPNLTLIAEENAPSGSKDEGADVIKPLLEGKKTCWKMLLTPYILILQPFNRMLVLRIYVFTVIAPYVSSYPRI